MTTVGHTVPVSVTLSISVCVPISTHPVLVVVALTTAQAVTQEAYADQVHETRVFRVVSKNVSQTVFVVRAASCAEVNEANGHPCCVLNS